MENELTVYQKIADPCEAVREMGKQVALSGVFGDVNASVGAIVAWECLATNTSLLTLARRFHFIHNRLSMRAETMLADFRKKAGGHHKLIKRTPEEATVELTRDGESNTFSLTWAEALQEPFVYLGKESEIVAKLANNKMEGLRLKPKYATPRARMQMLWARLISDSIRVLAPEIVTGVYAPEECDDFAGPKNQPTDPVVDIKMVEPAKTLTPAKAFTPTPPTATGPVVSLKEDPYTQDDDAMCGPGMGDQLEALAEAVKMPPETMKALLQKYNAGSPAGLPYKVATELMSVLKQQYSDLDIPF